jgi:bisphosphoglycerate-independent phosphoglycerate mutase (AlkP superfamily)
MIGKKHYNPVALLEKAFKNPQREKVIHLIGLFSTATLQSSLDNWIFAIEFAGRAGLDFIVLHLISDGLDVDKKSLVKIWKMFVRKYSDRLKGLEYKIILGSLGGRTYAMDKNKKWENTALAVEKMVDYKIVDQKDDGANNVYKKLIKNKYNIDLDKIYEGFSEKYDVDDWDKIKQEPGKNHFSYNDTTHLFMYTKADMDERRRLDPLRADIKWALELATEPWYKKTQIYDSNLIPTNFYYLPMDITIKPEFNKARLINKNQCLWFINYGVEEMQQLATLFCQINQELNLNLLILSMNNYEIKQEKILNEDLSNFDENDLSKSYYPIYTNFSMI